jgi:hypothetical protein
MSALEQDAVSLVAEADPGRVAARMAVLQAHTSPVEFAAAVCFTLEPILQQARADRDRAHGLYVQAEERVVELERLAAAAEGVAAGPAVDGAPAAFRVVAGRQIAEVAILEARALGRSELHYDEWFRLFREAGWVIESKDPRATFLTNLSRCGRVEHVRERSGVYRIKEEQ